MKISGKREGKQAELTAGRKINYLKIGCVAAMAVYGIVCARDAAVPLVSVGGGADTIHDWHYILSRIGLLRWDRGLGNAVFILGIAVMTASIVRGVYHSVDREEPEEGLHESRR